ncbi:autophagy protein, partial [Penicillium malachiteum]
QNCLKSTMIVSDPASRDDPHAGSLPVLDPPTLVDGVQDKNPMTKWMRNIPRQNWKSGHITHFAPTAFQNLLSQAAGDNNTLSFAGSPRSINGIVLLCNGISFGIQIAVFLVIGSFADFRNWRPNILIVLSIVAYALGFAWLGVHTADKWQIGVGLYIIGLIAYQTTLTFWTAALPGLACNTPEMRDHAADLAAGKISRDEYDFADTMKRSQLANIAFYVQSLAEIVILAIIVGIMFKIDVNASEAKNNWGLSVLIAFASGVWLLVSLPWFFLEKRRPGLNQFNRNIVLAGLSQLSHAMSQLASNPCPQAVGIYLFWSIQRQYKIGTKAILNTIAFCIILLDGWGMIGNWTTRFGFHHVWEVWIMISEVTPRGHEFLFFSLFSIIGKTSLFIGPIVSSAIIDATPSKNSSTPFYFLFALSLLSFGILVVGVDLKKSRVEQEQFLEERK